MLGQQQRFTSHDWGKVDACKSKRNKRLKAKTEKIGNGSNHSRHHRDQKNKSKYLHNSPLRLSQRISLYFLSLSDNKTNFIRISHSLGGKVNIHSTQVAHIITSYVNLWS